MPWRWYPKFNKVVRADGTVARYKSRCKKWLKFHKPYKPQKRGLEKQSIYSKKFGFLDLYSKKEQQGLICPSGYSVSQCFNVMRGMWHGYHRARLDEKNVEKMIKYAKAIQGVQEDMGIKTTSFPHLGLYGDVLILNNKKGERIAFEDHSALKQKQQEYEKWQAENAKKIQEELQKPDKEKGEEIQIFADDLSPGEMDEDIEETVPALLEAEADEEKEEEEIVMTDDIPFQNRETRDE